ncbi:MAG: MBL fold metallo-hydrolase [Acidobacteria bacterium]|nr:MBL fold metallo-hydrolase [Acidobacteriota bacterium]
MLRGLAVAALAGLLVPAGAEAQKTFAGDSFETSGGELKITFIGHGTLMLTYAGKVIHVDPVSMYADYATMPKADLVLVTHEHGDHLDAKAVAAVSTSRTVVAANEKAAGSLGGAVVMKNGDARTLAGIPVEAVPAYNFEKAFHPKGNGNGYVLTFGDRRVYIAGDTENVPEIKKLEGIDIAFLPMNQPFTMTPEQVADTARSLRPRVLYPYHFGETDTSKLVELLKGEEGIDVRIRQLQ